MKSELHLLRDDRPVHLNDLRPRVTREPDDVASEERVAIGDKPLDLAATRPGAFELAELPFCVARQLGGARLACPASEPWMRWDTRHAQRDSVLHRHVSSAPVDEIRRQA